jgi:hypothetical protein
MWRFLQRHHSKAAYGFQHATYAAILGAVIVACVSGLTRTAGAQEEQLFKTGQADHPILIGEHAGWNKNCDAIAPPALYLYEPPRHGSVCARVEDVKIHVMYVGNVAQCVGRVVRGVQFIYRPDRGFAGDDGLRYAAQYPSVLRTMSVAVTVTAHPPGAPDTSNIASPLQQAPQSPVPVPACDELVF